MSEEKPGKTLVIEFGDGYLSHAKIEKELFKLPGGVYSVSESFGRSFYKEIEVSNDKPIEVGNIPSLLCGEIRDFFNRRELFKKFGFAHKRGFLLYGPPGTGKSCMLRLIEDKFIKEFDGVVFVWDASMSIVTMIENFRKFEKDRAVMVVCEDIDQCIGDFETEMLEFLDGQKALDNFVMVSTTNHLENIPDRIKNRPSRIDRVIEVPPPPDFARADYLKSLGLDSAQATFIAENTQGMSMAELKEVVVSTFCLGMDVNDVLKRIGFQKETNAKANEAKNNRNGINKAELLKFLR